MGVFLYSKEFSVESRLHLFRLLGESLCIVAFAQDAGKAFHHPVQPIVVCCGYEGPVGGTVWVFAVYHLDVFWRHTPVTVFVTRHQSVFLILVAHVGYPFFCGWIISADSRQVAELVILHLHGERQCCRPCDVVGVVVPVCRCHIGYASVFSLGFSNVAVPFVVEQVVVEDKRFSQTAPCPVAEPRLPLVALRTVNGHSLVVGEYSPFRIVVNLVENGV